MNENIPLVIDADTCPDMDNIIMKNQCANCDYYCGFEMNLGRPCVKCSYYSNAPKYE